MDKAVCDSNRLGSERPPSGGCYVNGGAVDAGTQHSWQKALGGRRQAGLKGVQGGSRQRAGGVACLDAPLGESG